MTYKLENNRSESTGLGGVPTPKILSEARVKMMYKVEKNHSKEWVQKCTVVLLINHGFQWRTLGWEEPF
jgi:hypothetical protein